MTLPPFTDIGYAAQVLLEAANQLACPIHFTVDGIPLVATPSDTVKGIGAHYYAGIMEGVEHDKVS